MAVDDCRKFHTSNLHHNKSHYTLFVRSTHGYILNFLQDKGAKMHFNEVSMPHEIMHEMKNINPDLPDKLSFRYGIVDIESFKRDLKYWETLLASSMM